jgi:hypothetical protein
VVVSAQQTGVCLARPLKPQLRLHQAMRRALTGNSDACRSSRAALSSVSVGTTASPRKETRPPAYVLARLANAGAGSRSRCE